MWDRSWDAFSHISCFIFLFFFFFGCLPFLNNTFLFKTISFPLWELHPVINWVSYIIYTRISSNPLLCHILHSLQQCCAPLMTLLWSFYHRVKQIFLICPSPGLLWLFLAFLIDLWLTCHSLKKKVGMLSNTGKFLGRLGRITIFKTSVLLTY